ncbi:MAG: M23 family metallopeptidase [Hyphomicrobiaceae bacterium]|nr:M23 family metallopeptidase [Hyphomicrobiaceae bacterium]MCC0023547.1 M23 family metallopeptidase [Hyphomicrobiaceae bacterium]
MPSSVSSRVTRLHRLLKRPVAIYTLFGLLVASNVLTGVALLMTPEITSLFASAPDRSYTAYEERMLALRMEVDRLHSRQYRQAGDLNLQMQELAQQQQFLAEQHSFVRILAEKAEELGLDIDLGDSQTTAAIAPASLPDPSQDGDSSIQSFQTSLDHMVDESRLALAAIGEAADKSTSEIVSGLRELGVRPDFSDVQSEAMGGPFMPPEEGDGSSTSLAENANNVMVSLEKFDIARSTLQGLPVFYPFTSRHSISSGFGNRKDPFGGYSAFHSGVDFPATSGTPVLAAGYGKVTYAGRMNGYGNLIEIEHNGIKTRYGHLSYIGVKVGQIVSAGEVIGKVGSTGRSTGPHLHFEIRINDTPKNPMPYINISRSLSEYLTG